MRPLLIFAFLSSSLIAFAADPLIGTWSLNPAKSKYQAGSPPKSMVITYEAKGKGIKYTSSGTDAEGKPIASTYTADYDGKESTVAGSKDWAPVVLKRVDQRTLEAKYIKFGKPRAVATSVVSRDGKTLTITTVVQNPKGYSFTNVGIYEKKPAQMAGAR